MALGRPWMAEGLTREHPGIIRNAALRGQRLLATNAHAPEAAIDRIGRTKRRYGQASRLQEIEFFLTLEVPVAHGRDDFEFGRQSAQCDFEAHLVVACRRAAMGNAAGAELTGHQRNGLRLHDALGADAERVQLPAPHVAHDEKAQHLLEVIGARIDLVVLARPKGEGPFVQGPGRGRIDATRIHRDGDDRALVLLLEPGNEERGVETARIGENDGLGHGRSFRDETDRVDARRGWLAPPRYRWR